MKPEEVIQTCKEMMEKGEVELKYEGDNWFRFLLTQKGKEEYPEGDCEYTYCPIATASIKIFKEEGRAFRADGEELIYNSNFDYLAKILGLSDEEMHELVGAADGNTKSRFFPLLRKTFLPRENQNETRD